MQLHKLNLELMTKSQLEAELFRLRKEIEDAKRWRRDWHNLPNGLQILVKDNTTGNIVVSESEFAKACFSSDSTFRII